MDRCARDAYFKMVQRETTFLVCVLLAVFCPSLYTSDPVDGCRRLKVKHIEWQVSCIAAVEAGNSRSFRTRMNRSQGHRQDLLYRTLWLYLHLTGLTLLLVAGFCGQIDILYPEEIQARKEKYREIDMIQFVVGDSTDAQVGCGECFQVVASWLWRWLPRTSDCKVNVNDSIHVFRRIGHMV